MRSTVLLQPFVSCEKNHPVVQLNLAIMDLKGPKIFICYRRISTIANMKIEEIFIEVTKKIFLFSSVVGGFSLLLDPV